MTNNSHFLIKILFSYFFFQLLLYLSEKTPQQIDLQENHADNILLSETFH